MSYHNGHGQPSPPHSIEGTSGSPKVLMLSNQTQPQTPPRAVLQQQQQYSYDDPTLYGSSTAQMYYEQQPVMYYQEQSYHTPPSGEDTGIQTRSGKSLRSPSGDTTPSFSRSSRTTLSRKAKPAKKSKSITPTITEPLSIVTKDYNIPVMDIEEWANRPDEIRYREVKEKHKGRVPRPMNSFMLYRTAYKERIKKWGQQGDNNQLISKIAGICWPLEPQELREYYQRCALLERDNHAKAFPNYKFAPNKNAKKRAHDDDEDEDGSDAEYQGHSRSTSKRPCKDGERDTPRSLSGTPFEDRRAIYTPPELQVHPSSFHASNPHAMQPHFMVDQYGRPVVYGQMYQPVPMQYMGQPSKMHFATMQQRIPYDFGGVVAMPQGMNQVAMHPNMIRRSEPVIDPNLEEFNPDTLYEYPHQEIPEQGAQATREHEGREGFYNPEGEPVSHPGMQMLTAEEQDWTEPGPAGADFDVEFGGGWPM